MGLLAEHRTHLLPKHGHRPGETEDAIAGPLEGGGGVRAAVADGATESAFAGLWAGILAAAAATAPIAEAIPAARVRFAQAARTWSATPRPWYAEAKVEEGAYATVLSLALREGGGWAAEAVGDAVMLHLRGGGLLRAWPLDDPAAFSNTPPLVSSRADVHPPQCLATEGTWAPGDRFLLATDALAAYLLANDPSAVAGMDGKAFEAFVAEARGGGLRNDDVALLDLLLA